MRGAALAANWRPLSPRPGAKRDAAGHALVTRNGDARDRLVPTNGRAGALRVSDRRVEERTGETRKFSSRILPPTLVGPRKERGPPPLLAWVVHRGGGPGARGLRRLVGRALLGDHPAAEVRRPPRGHPPGMTDPSSVITRRRRSDRMRPGVLDRDLRDVDSVESSADRVQLRPPGKDASLCLVVGVRLDRRRARPDHRRRPGVDRLSGRLFFDRSPSDSAMGVSGPRPSGTG